MQNESIRNIIFDLGNVIINIDTEFSVRAMRELGFKDFEKSYSLFKQTDLFDRLEKGLIDPDYFRTELRKHLEHNVPDKDFDKAWGAMLLDFPKARIDLIKDLGKKYNIYLLSNTNAIHYDQYTQDFIDQYGFEFNSLFVRAYYSFQTGMRKPDADIYEFALSNSNLLPEETLFVDDLPINIESAEKANLQTMWIDISKGEDIVNKLNGF